MEGILEKGWVLCALAAVPVGLWGLCVSGIAHARRTELCWLGESSRWSACNSQLGGARRHRWTGAWQPELLSLVGPPLNIGESGGGARTPEAFVREARNQRLQPSQSLFWGSGSTPPGLRLKASFESQHVGSPRQAALYPIGVPMDH